MIRELRIRFRLWQKSGQWSALYDVFTMSDPQFLGWVPDDADFLIVATPLGQQYVRNENKGKRLTPLYAFKVVGP